MEGSEPNSYIISLDKTDHNFLTEININNYKSYGTVPLWSKTNYEDYYEFEIRASRIVEVEASPTYKCHICNINVPIAYNKKHNDSTKHRTSLKIMDIALKRAQLLMTQDNVLNSTDTNYNMYFCAPCATEVQLKDKLNHEATKQHSISVKHDKILKDLLNIYMYDVKSDEYIKTVDDYTNNDDVEVITETNMDCHTIEINAINGSVINVPFNNFHGYFKVGKHIQCRVCKVLIEDRHKMSHMLSEEHKNIILVPIKDVHCIRMMDEIWCHCILCNEIIMDVQLHTLSSSHNDKLREALILNTEKSQTSNHIDKDTCDISNEWLHRNGTKYTNCDICNIQLPVATMRSHLRGMKHKNNLNLNNACKIANSGSEKLQYLIKTNDKLEITCRVCLAMIDNIDDHVLTDEHISKYNDLLKTNTVSRGRDRFHCEICDAYFLERYEIYHTSGKKHVKLLKKRNSMLKSTEPSQSQLNSDVAQSIAKLNNDISPSTDRQSTSHSNKDVESNKISDLALTSTSQLNNKVSQSYSELQKSNSSIETSKTMKNSNNGTSKTISEPNMDETSKSNFSTFEDIFETLREAIFNGQSNSVSESSYKTTEMEPSETASVSNDQNSDTFIPILTDMNSLAYYCQTCKVVVPNNEFNINEHINGSNHQNKLINEDTNTSISNIHTSNNKDNTNYYCQPCKVNLTNNDSNISEHKAGNKHQSNAQKLKEALEIKPINGNEKGLQKKENNINATKALNINYVFKVINNHNLYCKVCKILIKHTSNDEHIECIFHREKYNKMLQLNKVWRRKADNRFVCDYCHVEITNYNEIDHINGRQHAAKVTKTTENSIIENPLNALVVKKRVRSRKKKTGDSIKE